tara:strand:+ start:436 stop:951 length:516 start_codon:yes stop_codon:yes gene_type:complete
MGITALQRLREEVKRLNEVIKKLKEERGGRHALAILPGEIKKIKKDIREQVVNDINEEQVEMIENLKEERDDALKEKEQYSQDADRATEAEAELEELKEENRRLNKSRNAWMKTANQRHTEIHKLQEENKNLTEENVEYESVEQSLMNIAREGGGYDEMLPIHYREEEEQQ